MRSPLHLRVLKFGGSSLAGIDLIEAAAERVHSVREAGVRPIVVVSAISGTTNRLLSTARRIHPEPTSSELDRLLATGEMQAAALLAIALAKRGVGARSFSGGEAGIITDDDFGRARILKVDGAPVTAALEAGEIPIIAGFQGITKDGRVTTLGRGGTDITAAVLGVYFQTDRIVYYRDADGIYSIDPKLLPVSGGRIDRLEYDSMIDLAEAGVPILHPQALEVARAHGVELELRSYRESGGGTVVGEGPYPSPLPIWSVCLSPPICLLTLEGLVKETSSLARLAALLDRTDLPLDAALHQGGSNLCLTIQAPDLDGPILKRQVEDFLREEKGVRIQLERNRRRVTLVGTGVTGRKTSTAVEQAGAKLGPPLFTFTGTRHRAFVVPESEGPSWVTNLYQTLIKP